jgi:uncharacterized protein
MEPTSSPTSSEPSPVSEHGADRRPFAAWSVLVAALILLAFAGRAGGGTDDDAGQAFFEYAFSASAVVFYGIMVGLTLLIARFYARPREALGLRRFPLRYVWLGLAVAVGGIVVSASLEPLLRAGEAQGLTPERWENDRAPAFVLSALAVVVVAPFAEELLFRGLGTRVLAFAGTAVAIVVTALAFALVHGLLVAVPSLGIFALGLAWLRIRSDSVWPAVVAHAAYNLVGVLLALYLSLNPDEARALAALL